MVRFAIYMESDLAEVLTESHRGRDPRILARKYALMRTARHPFLRGSCALFYRAWSASPILDSAPAAWISGDLHVENFGSYKGDNGLTYFDLNDFDETALAPATWDIARLLTSILVGARDIGLDTGSSTALVQRALAAYVTEIRTAKSRWIERETARGVVRDLLVQAGTRTRTQLLNRYTRRKGQRRLFTPDDRRILPVSTTARMRAERMIHAIAKTSTEADFFDVIDVAQRVAGNGALGVERFVVLVKGHGHPDRNALIDLKQQRHSSVAPSSPSVQPVWSSDGERVCAVQHRAQAISPALLRAVSDRTRSFVLRELQPVADRLDLSSLTAKPKRLRTAVDVCGRLAAWAHVRSASWRGAASVDEWLVFGQRTDWQRALMQRARAAAAQNAKDYRAFSKLYDAGAFRAT